jgi:hypothetical protein
MSEAYCGTNLGCANRSSTVCLGCCYFPVLCVYMKLVGNAHEAVLPRAPTRYAHIARGISPRLRQPDDNDSSNSSRD